MAAAGVVVAEAITRENRLRARPRVVRVARAAEAEEEAQSTHLQAPPLRVAVVVVAVVVVAALAEPVALAATRPDSPPGATPEPSWRPTTPKASRRERCR